MKYISIGFFFWALGSVFFGGATAFLARSEPAQLVVLQMDTKKNTDGAIKYRPVFALADSPSGASYAGNIWVHPKPHEVGDIVPGRYDPVQGDMRSDAMLRRSVWIGRLARILGAVIALQAIALVLGVPEQRLPLKVILGSRTRRFRRLI